MQEILHEMQGSNERKYRVKWRGMVVLRWKHPAVFEIATEKSVTDHGLCWPHKHEASGDCQLETHI